jgi:hypothetical protein
MLQFNGDWRFESPGAVPARRALGIDPAETLRGE